MIKQVYKISNGQTFEDFDIAKAHMLEILANNIGKIIDKNIGSAILSENFTKQKLAIFNMLTTDNKKLVSLMKQYTELEAQREPDND